ncbi:MAG: hypothetical protein K2M46_14445 [Lachnospiraceae bacterium]|nr:hypothetical protein [Lachnospiraceae bacterium]
MKNVNVIVFLGDEMKSYGGYLADWQTEGARELDATLLEDCHRQIITIPPTRAKAVVELQQQIIELDPTTMKRIAMFNLEKENEKLLFEIEQNKKKIEGLKGEYEELLKRLETISQIGKDIWENGTENESENEYDDYD